MQNSEAKKGFVPAGGPALTQPGEQEQEILTLSSPGNLNILSEAASRSPW